MPMQTHTRERATADIRGGSVASMFSLTRVSDPSAECQHSGPHSPPGPQLKLEKVLVSFRFCCFFSETAIFDSKLTAVTKGTQQQASTTEVQLCGSLSTALKIPNLIHSSALLGTAPAARGGPSCLGQAGAVQQQNRALLCWVPS